MQHITKVAPLFSLSKKLLSTPNMNLELFPGFSGNNSSFCIYDLYSIFLHV